MIDEEAVHVCEYTNNTIGSCATHCRDTHVHTGLTGRAASHGPALLGATRAGPVCVRVRIDEEAVHVCEYTNNTMGSYTLQRHTLNLLVVVAGMALRCWVLRVLALCVCVSEDR
jgi:hypothetical protein